MFSDAFRELIQKGEYTRWACSLSPTQLKGLFWAIGEFSSRKSFSIEELEALLNIDLKQNEFGRSHVGLKIILQCASGRFLPSGLVPVERMSFHGRGITMLFTDEFRHELEAGEYSRWTNNLSLEQLVILFWGIGEFSRRSFTPNEIEAFLRAAKQYDIHPRALIGLKLLLQFVSGQHRTVDEVIAEISLATASPAEILIG